jgi:hypothetical protein
MPEAPQPRWGVRFTSNTNRRQQYVQDLYTNDPSTVKRGELFLNEVHEELYYVGADGVAKTVNGTSPVLFSRINFTGIRQFANDAEAGAATPPVPVGGLYHTSGVLKVRLA